MNKIITLLLIGISYSSHAQQISIPTAKTNDLRGAVKSVLEKSVLFLSDGYRYDTRHIYSEYAKNGNEVAYKFVTSVAENKFSRTERTFNDLHQLQEVSMYEDSVLIEKRQYEYNSENHLSKESMYKGNGYLFQKSIFSYDVYGNFTEMQLWSSDTYFVLKQLYEYDPNGNRLSLKNYTNDGKLTYEYTYEYDGTNNKTKMVYKKANNPVVQTTNYTYNEKNELIKLERYDNDRLVHTMEYTYNEKGHVTETVNKGTTSLTRIVARYAENGLLLETFEYKNDELAVHQTYSYEYDTNGNWIKRLNSYNGEAPSLTEREIVYY